MSSTFAPVAPFHDIFAVVDTLVLEETERVLTVQPLLYPDPLDGLFVVDRREAQIRRYDLDGHLIWHFGRPGPGPEEFTIPQAVARGSQNQIVAAQLSRRVVIWNEDSQSTERVVTVPMNIARLHGLGGSRVLIESFVSLDRGPALHVLDVDSGRLVDSFFAPVVSPLIRSEDVVSLSGRVPSAVRGDTIAVMFAYADTIHILDSKGSSLEKIVLPSTIFRMPSATVDELGSRRRWLEQTDRVMWLYWTERGDFIVVYTRALEESYRYSLLALARDGTGLFDIPEIPSALRVVDRFGRFYFEDSESLFPNRYLVAILR